MEHRVLMLCIPVPLPQSTAVFCEYLCTHFCKVHSVPFSLCQFTSCCTPKAFFWLFPFSSLPFICVLTVLWAVLTSFKIWLERKKQLELIKCSHPFFFGWIDFRHIKLINYLWTPSASNSQNSFRVPNMQWLESLCPFFVGIVVRSFFHDWLN